MAAHSSRGARTRPPSLGFFAHCPIPGRDGAVPSLLFSLSDLVSSLPLSRLLILLLLLMAGIHPNPGPSSSRGGPRYPCGACNQSVRSNCRSVQCSVCKCWLHHRCTSLSLCAFRALPRRHFWSCSSCSPSNVQHSSRLQPRVVLSRLPATTSSSSLVTPSSSHLQPRVILTRLPACPPAPSPASRAYSPPPAHPSPLRGADISTSLPRDRYSQRPPSPAPSRSPASPAVPLPPAPALSSEYPPSAFRLPSILPFVLSLFAPTCGLSLSIFS